MLSLSLFFPHFTLCFWFPSLSSRYSLSSRTQLKQKVKKKEKKSQPVCSFTLSECLSLCVSLHCPVNWENTQMIKHIGRWIYRGTSWVWWVSSSLLGALMDQTEVHEVRSLGSEHGSPFLRMNNWYVPYCDGCPFLDKNLWLSPGPLNNSTAELEPIDSTESQSSYLLLPKQPLCYLLTAGGRKAARETVERRERGKWHAEDCGPVFTVTVTVFILSLHFPSFSVQQYPKSFSEGFNNIINIYCMWQKTVLCKWTSIYCINEIVSLQNLKKKENWKLFLSNIKFHQLYKIFLYWAFYLLLLVL